MGGSISTRLRVVNETNTDIDNIHVWSIDNYDWGSDSRPDHNFKGYSIRAHSHREQPEDLNKNASNCPFNMKLYFSNGLVDEFRIHQRHAIGDTSGFDHFVRNHDIYYRREGDSTLVIEVKNTAQQLAEERAEQLNKEGEMLLSDGKYAEAIAKFEQAYNLAGKREYEQNMISAKQSQQNEMNRQEARRHNEEGLRHLNNKQYSQAISSFEAALALDNKQEYLNNKKSAISKAESAQRQNEIEKNARKLNEEGKVLMKQGQYDLAFSKFDEALKLVNNTEYKNNKELAAKAKIGAQHQKVVEEGNKLMNTNLQNAKVHFENAIKTSSNEEYSSVYKQKLATVLLKQSDLLTKEAWDAENDKENDKSDEAYQKFADAKNTLITAINVHGTKEMSQKLATLQLKIEGNELFNKGSAMEQEGINLYKEAKREESLKQYGISKQKMIEAQSKYKEAKSKFDEGLKADSRFEGSVEFVASMISDISSEISNMEQLEMKLNLNGLHINNTTKVTADDEALAGEHRGDQLSYEIGTLSPVA